MKILKLTFFAFFFCAASFAQGGRLQEKREQLKALKIAFITSELNLTADEAVKFWPLYNEFEDRQQGFRKQKFRSYLERANAAAIDKMTEKEAAAVLSQMEASEDELYQLHKKFIAGLKGVIPAVKIIKLKKAEEDFNRKLLKQYRDKRQR